MPANAIPDSSVITFIYEKAGNRVEFTADKFPADFDADVYKYIDRYDKLIRKGKNNEPPIKGLVLTGHTETDSSQIVLNHPYAVLLFAEDFSTPVKEWAHAFEKLYQKATEKNIPVYMITTRFNEVPAQIAGTAFAGIPVFKCDVTTVRTAARSNPCVYILQQGTILGKWSAKQMNKAEAVLDKATAQPKEIKEEIQINPSIGVVNNADTNQVKTDTIKNN